MSRTYQKLPFFSALLPCRGWHVPRRRQPSPVPHTSLMSSSSCCVLFPQLRTRHSSRYYRLCRVTFWCPQQGVFLGADVWFSPGGLCEVSFPWLMQCCPFGCICGISVRWNMLGGFPSVYAGSPFEGRCRVSGRMGLCGVSFREHHLCVLLVAYAGCLSGDRGMVSARGRGRSSVRGTMKSIRLGAEEGCPFGGRRRVSFWWAM